MEEVARGGERSSLFWFLVENHDIAVTPSIEMLLGREKARPVFAEAKEMLLVADPVYGAADPRVARMFDHVDIYTSFSRPA